MWVITLRRLYRSKTAMVGLAIVVLLFVVAVLADVIAPYSPTQTTAGQHVPCPPGNISWVPISWGGMSSVGSSMAVACRCTLA